VVNVASPELARPHIAWPTALWFAVACGLLAESVELLHIQTGGVLPPGWSLRGSLFFTYGLVGALVFGVAALVSRRRALAVAATAFALVIVLPWLNFTVLPRLISLRSLLGNGAAIILVALLVPFLIRRPRVALTAILVLALGVNLWPLVRGGGVHAGRKVARAAPPFNIMLVLIDTLRADHLGAYGYDRPTSPNFDKLARDSVVFDRTTSQAAWTKPSVASLMTGVFVHKHGVVSSRDALGTDRGTMAEALAWVLAAIVTLHFPAIRGLPRSFASSAASTSSKRVAQWRRSSPISTRCCAVSTVPSRRAVFRSTSRVWRSGARAATSATPSAIGC
jgi:hypothetical protein